MYVILLCIIFVIMYIYHVDIQLVKRLLQYDCLSFNNLKQFTVLCEFTAKYQNSKLFNDIIEYMTQNDIPIHQYQHIPTIAIS